jgi:hypothetical protein
VKRIVFFVGCLGTFVAATASAQTGGASNRAAAEALFNQGRSLAASGKYAEACPKFEASEQLDPGLGTLLNLADCYEKLGKTASAWAEYREAIPLARAAGSKVREDLAIERAKALESRLSMLTIRALGGEDSAGLDIRRDGIPVLPAELGSPIPVDPGPHTVEAVAPGKQKWTSTVQLRDAQKLEVEVPALVASDHASAVAVGAEKPVVAPPVEQSAQPNSSQRTTAIVVGAVGVVGVGLGTIFGLGASSKWSDAKSHCSAYPYGCDAEGLDARSSANSKATISTVAFIVGGAALTGAAVLWFTAGSSKEQNTAVGVGPGSAFVRGSF